MPYVPPQATNLRRVVMQPSFEAVDSFGRLRVSQPETLFDSKQLDDNQPLVLGIRRLMGTTETFYGTLSWLELS